MVQPKTAILQVLLSKNLYGLEIMEQIKKLSDGMTVISEGNLYPALRELKKEGLIEVVKMQENAEQTKRRKCGRPRIYYKLTRAGLQRALKQRLAASKLFSLAVPYQSAK